MTENNNNDNIIEENKSNSSVKGQINDWRARHSVISVIICLFLLGSLVSLTGCKDKSEADDGSSNINRVKFAADQHSAFCRVTAEGYYASEDPLFVVYFSKQENQTAAAIRGLNVLQTCLQESETIDLEVEIGDGTPWTYKASCFNRIALFVDSKTFFTQLIPAFNEKTMTVKLPSGRRLNFNIEGFNECLMTMVKFLPD